jgi:acetyl esterase/lipase
MASIQHDVLRMSLNNVGWFFKLNTVGINQLRGLLQLGTLGMFIPLGVNLKRAQINNREAEWLIPDNAHPDKVLLYFHGGGYALGSTDTHRSMVGRIAKKSGIRCLLASYRRIPESAYPAALNDGVAAYEWLLNEGYAAENILIGGDSAGGGLAITTQLKLREKGMPLPGGTICLSPWTDLAITGDSVQRNTYKDPLTDIPLMKKWGRLYAGNQPITNPLVSPMYGELTDLGPMLIQVSTDEVLYDDARRLAEHAERDNVEVDFQVWEGLMHWWHLFWQTVPEGREAIDNVIEFMRAQGFYLDTTNTATKS